MNAIIKYTIPFILLIFFSCKAQNQNESYHFEVIYKAQTRGSFVRIEFKDNTIFYKSTTNEISRKLNHKETSEVNKIITKINLSKIENLKAPTNKRFTDGALIANFTIKRNGVIYKSSDFDHENPPNKLKDLYKLLKEFL